MNEVLEKIQKIGIVPVVVLNDAKDAAPLAKALCDGGLPCAEVTFRTEAAEESIRIMAEQFPQMLVGAGTVLTTEQVDRAVAAGAKFIVSPGLNPKVVKYCIEKGVPVTPGTANPSDVEQAIELGLEVVKFFPAEAAGGLNMIKSMAAPYTNMKFMPTEEAVMTMLGFELKHIGINCENEEEAEKTAGTFASLFGFEKKSGNSSVFAGSAVEAMKSPYLGAKGHIAVGTNSVDRAVNYLESQGVEFNMDSAKYKDGKLTAIYLKEEVAGFAVHLVQK